ncbi:MAG TPA: hypothetical protein DEB39_09240 [Planctomycetaceae bacterium]|nr:hypothetical protein [Planctomycetaceae bacterium]
MKTTTDPDIALVEEIAHTSVADCYQCGKCSAGCPQGQKMDRLPSTLIRMVQYGDVVEASRSAAVWQCVSCLTCSARCPKSVDIAGVLDALKQISIRRKTVHANYQRTVAFQKAFLEILRRNGRTNELEMVVLYKTLGFFGDVSTNPLRSIPSALKDAHLGPAMLLKGKLHVKLGGPLKDKALVRRIFKKCEKKVES